MSRSSSNSSESWQSPVYINPVAFKVYQWMSYGVLCQLINIFGLVTNTINIICFVKQGFKEAINISLLGLAISDFGCVLTLLIMNIFLNPAMQEATLPIEPLEYNYLMVGMPHLLLTRATSCITAFVTLERCLCVTMPLKVKSVFTPKRVTTIVVCIYTLLIFSFMPIYFVTGYGPKYFPKRNRTIIGLVFTEDRDFVEAISFPISHVFVPFGTFFVILVCMIVMVRSLKKQAQWRRTMSIPIKVDTAREKEQKVSKMVVMISILFVVCFTPAGIIFIPMVVVPGFSTGGKLQDILVIVYGITLMLESTNSSSNIFIYYRMSSKYRAVFWQLFSSRRCFWMRKKAPDSY